MQRSRETLWRGTARGALLLSPDGSICSLCPVGTWIWGRLAQSRNLSDLAREAADAFGVDAASVRGDLEALLGELCDRGHVVVVGP